MSTWARVRSLPALILIGLVRAYQLVISPWTPPTCKYYPSCSSYAVTALRRHGALRGGWLAARRLGRCHPWAAGGVDDVPPVVDRSGPVDAAAEHAPHQTSARTGHHIAHAGHH